VKNIRTVALIVLVSVLAAIGCLRRVRHDMDSQQLVTDYDRIWQAMGTVMTRHFQVTWADKAEGVIKAKPLRSDGKMGPGELRVSARIVPSPAGGFDVEVRAVNYIDISEPRALSKKTVPYDLVPVSFDTTLQAQLLDEIDDVRFEGRRAGYESKSLASPKEAVQVMPGK